ncbi:MAG: septal ring lytic transglycosylase RlpA family protein [Gemmatimonadales bacterium]|nr:MAG: septal ring lytic transglycosylase RlpA family protein [Gemmatimonadales bacterium]
MGAPVGHRNGHGMGRRVGHPMGRRCAMACLLVLWVSTGCSLLHRPQPPGPAPTAPEPGEWVEEGIASWYGHPFHGRQTASGETYDMEAPTAAHQTLPFGTVVEVRNLDNGRMTELEINDRGPFVDDRIIDVSRWGARELGMLGPGLARVRLRILESPEPVRCWRVQTGSFREEANARAEVRRLEDAGLPAQIVSTADGLHRVRAGPFQTRDRAREVASERGGLVLAC